MGGRDDEDVTAFVKASYGRLMRTAYLLCGDLGHAEDLVQTTLAKTVVAWSRLKQSESIDHYVQRTLINTYLSARRRRSWWEQPLARLTEGRANDEYIAVEQRDWLRRALAALPARQRAAVILRFYGDLSEHDAAEVLGCSVGTIKSLSSRGLRSLRTRLDHVEPDNENEVRYA